MFDDVWYNLDETTAKNAFNGITTVKGTETMSDWGISVNQDGTATSAGTADFAMPTTWTARWRFQSERRAVFES